MCVFNWLVACLNIFLISFSFEGRYSWAHENELIQENEILDHYDSELTGCSANKSPENPNITRGVYATVELWPNGTVYYKFKQENGYKIEDEYKNKILLAMEVISNGTCITFIEAPSRTRGVISIQRASELRGSICQAEPGYYRNTVQKLILSPESCSRFYTTAAVHELMHALGFLHEFQRRDRDNYLVFHRENIRRDFSNADIRDNFETLNDISDGLPFNFKSILQYHPTANAIPGKYVFTEREPTLGTLKPLGKFEDMGQSCLFSAGDRNMVQKFYHKQCGERFRMTQTDISIPFSDCNYYIGKSSGTGSSQNTITAPLVQSSGLKPFLPNGNGIV